MVEGCRPKFTDNRLNTVTPLNFPITIYMLPDFAGNSLLLLLNIHNKHFEFDSNRPAKSRKNTSNASVGAVWKPKRYPPITGTYQECKAEK